MKVRIRKVINETSTEMGATRVPSSAIFDKRITMEEIGGYAQICMFMQNTDEPLEEVLVCFEKDRAFLEPLIEKLKTLGYLRFIDGGWRIYPHPYED